MAKRAALAVAAVAAREMSTPKHGVPGPFARRSAPGEAPARQRLNLLGSIIVERAGTGAYRVGSPVKYGYWLEFGTGPYTIRPKRGKYLSWQNADGEWLFATEVHHPGIAARPWLRPAVLKVKGLFKGKGLTFGKVGHMK